MAVVLEVEWDPTPEDVGRALAGMNDDAQARVFVAAARELERLIEDDRRDRPLSFNLGAEWQWEEAGRHLAACECSTEGARNLIRAVARGIDSAGQGHD